MSASPQTSAALALLLDRVAEHVRRYGPMRDVGAAQMRVDAGRRRDVMEAMYQVARVSEPPRRCCAGRLAASRPGG